MAMKYGYLVERVLDPRDWSFGGVSGITNDVLVVDGQWDLWIPPLEVQTNEYLETMACVSFATENCIETILNRKYSLDMNYSDRALAKMSDTKRTGNSMSKVAETAREGLLMEYQWPFEGKTWEEFYKEIPSEIKVKTNDFTDEFEVQWEWVFSQDPERIKEALKYSPLAVAVYAWESPIDGLYPRSEKPQNHLVTLYGYDDGRCWRIYDSYKNCYKNLAWNFNFGAKMKFNLIRKSEKPMPKYSFDNNTLLQLVEGTGGFGLYLEGKIIVDSLDKVLASWLVRNSGNISGKVRAVTTEIWESFKKVNLKGEEV
jgi:hypothetical protein